METVRIIRDFSFPQNLFHQTPGGLGRWGEFQFTEESIEDSDFLVILNRSLVSFRTQCPPERTWCFTMEPPIPEYQHFRDTYRYAGHVLSPLVRRKDPSQWQIFHGSLPWHIELDWDTLQGLSCPQKTKELSWITSSSISFSGHRKRMDFLNEIRWKIPFDLYGRGFQPVEGKSVAHLDYAFSIVVENCSAPHYWTEKLMDSLLCWTFPFYYGAPNIGDYFPEGSYQWIDIERPDEAVQIIRKKLDEGITAENLVAMGEARKRILNQYQLFPRMAKLIQEWKKSPAVDGESDQKMRTIPAVLDIRDRKTSIEYWMRKSEEFKRRARGRWQRWTANS